MKTWRPIGSYERVVPSPDLIGTLMA